MKQIYVVEGLHDVDRLKRYNPNFEIVSVGGSAIQKKSLDYLKEASKTHEMILCLDPDHAGERIRRILSKELLNVTHVFLKQEESYSKNFKKIGFEHVSDEVLDHAFSHIRKENLKSVSDVDFAFLHEIGVIGSPNSGILREILSEAFHLGHVNGKKILERIKAFNIMKKDIIGVLNERT